MKSTAIVAEALKAWLATLDDCGDVPYVEQPAALLLAIRDLLDRTSPTPA